jgi:predicted transcriptional regulator
MEQKDSYTLQELYEELPISLVELADRAGLNEVTVARIRDGKATRRTSVNKLLLVFSEVYERPLTLKSVTGINVQVNRRQERREAKKQQATPSNAV